MTTPTQAPWRFRILGSGVEDPTQLLANPRNWRIDPRSQQRALEGALDQVGWVQQVIVNQRTGHVVDGHLRVELAISRSEPEVPVLYVDLSPDEEALVLASLDPLAAMAGTDEAKLRELLAGVTIDNEDLVRALERLAPASHQNTGEDDIPPVPAEPYVKAGELWLLGDHRLLVGDATNADDVARLLDGAAPGMMVTDPPYGVEYDPAERANRGSSLKLRRMGKVLNDDRADWQEAWALCPADVIYVWHAALHSHTVADSLEAEGYELRAQIIWAKPQLSFGRGDYHWQHEPCWYAVREGKPGRRTDDRTQTSIWDIGTVRVGVTHGEDEATDHGTQKPVECMERPLLNHEPMDVYDPFVGSGTTVIAAEKRRVRCYAMDLSPAYAQVVIERWRAFTGREAVRG